MNYDRLEVRLDSDHQHKVAELREKYGTTSSEIIRRGIDAIYQEYRAKERSDALERILSHEGVDDVPEDPEELRRQNESLYDIRGMD